MSKRIVIIERCGGCKHSAIGFVAKTRHCGLSVEHYEDDCPENDIPDWCPLPALPERITERHSGSFDTINRIQGWNACLEEIEKDKEQFNGQDNHT